ncbi:MAG: RIP metalloprotease RseP [Lachnospiraceae bacterium]|nr:RIP metalloprotease RseP [Lachnospiraceae bacterium]
MSIIVALIIFSVIIIIHELGHFLLAKLNGVYVQEFTLGLGPTLFGFKMGETEYCLKALPFGGSCVMLGEEEACDDERAFNKKNVWQRMSIVLAGPVFNFILAFFLSLFLVGFSGADIPVISQVEPGSPAAEAGIMAGDEIVKMDGSPVYNFREIVYKMLLNKGGDPVTFVYERDGERQEVTITPKKSEAGNYLTGIAGGAKVKQDFFGVIKYAALEVRCQVKVVFWSLRYMISGYFTPDDIAGPVGIVNMIGDTYEEAKVYGVLTIFLSMVNIAVMISANLGVMNLLPIPALDGGRILFYLIEILRGKPMDPDKEGKIHMIGLMILLTLMVLILFNDVKNILF